MRELEERDPVIPQEVTDELAARRQEAEGYKAEIQRISQNAKDSLAEALQLRREKLQLERDMKDREELFHRRGMLYVLPSGEVTLILSSTEISQTQGPSPRVILERVTLSREAILSEKRKAMPLPDSPSQN